MKFLLRFLLPLLLLGAAAYLWFTLSQADVIVAEARRGVAIDAVAGNLKVIAALSAPVKSEAGARVVSVIQLPNTESREVKTGDVIVTLDTADLDPQIRILENELAEAREQARRGSTLAPYVENLAADLADAEALVSDGKIAPDEVDRLRREWQRHLHMMESENLRLQKQVSNVEEQLALRRRDRELRFLRAPIDGTLDLVFVLPGDLVTYNQHVATVVSAGRVIDVQISEEDVQNIAPGQTVQARLLAYGNRLFTGRVDWLAYTADPGTRRRSVMVSLEIEPALLTPGLTGQASIIRGERPGAVLIPRRALVGNTVRLVAGDRVEVRPVTPGFLGLGQAEILSGLEPGDLLIVETPHLFQQGDRIRVAQTVSF